MYLKYDGTELFRLGAQACLLLVFGLGVGGCEKTAPPSPAQQDPPASSPVDQAVSSQVVASPAVLPTGKPAVQPQPPEKKPAAEPSREELVRGIAAVIEEVYSLISGQPIDVIEVRNDPHLWRVVFRARVPESREQVVYVTRDGRYLIESLIDLPKRRDQLIGDKRFANCLKSRGVRIFADPKMPETRKQLEALGIFSKSLVINCAVAPENCKKLGVTALPAVAMGNRVTPGVQTRAWVETLSGCK